MHYTTEITINRPLEDVIEKFGDPQNLPKWQPTLQNMEHLSGEAGQKGAKTRMVYDQNGQTIDLIEEIVEKDLPRQFKAVYTTKGVYNVISARFEAIGDNQTRWIEENEFKFSGFMRIIGLFFRGSFPKQSEENMKLFKAFVEKS